MGGKTEKLSTRLNREAGGTADRGHRGPGRRSACITLIGNQHNAIVEARDVTAAAGNCQVQCNLT